MGIPGVDTILFKPARVVWPGERVPSEERARQFDQIPHMLDLGQFDEVASQLNKTASFELEPSQRMRLHFLRGQLCSDRQIYDQAYQAYRHALDIAHEYEDLDSQITLTDLSGLMMYGLMRHREALVHYQEALDLWYQRAAQLSQPRAEPEVKFRERIGTVQWHVGDIDDARTTLARALTVALYKRGVPHTDFIQSRSARALWTLGLTLRSQSDMRDGSVGHLRTAFKRLKRAGVLFEDANTEQENLGRLYVQIAEVYLDLAEIHLQRDAAEAARPMRSEALKYVREAAVLLRDADSRAGKLLPELTLLRYEITRQLNRTAIQEAAEFEVKLLGIEYEAADIGDKVISAKAATLRGEWCLWLGDPAPAREVLLLALVGFQHDNMGMATRAQRLLRRANAPTQ